MPISLECYTHLQTHFTIKNIESEFKQEQVLGSSCNRPIQGSNTKPSTGENTTHTQEGRTGLSCTSLDELATPERIAPLLH